MRVVPGVSENTPESKSAQGGGTKRWEGPGQPQHRGHPNPVPRAAIRASTVVPSATAVSTMPRKSNSRDTQIGLPRAAPKPTPSTPTPTTQSRCATCGQHVMWGWTWCATRQHFTAVFFERSAHPVEGSEQQDDPRKGIPRFGSGPLNHLVGRVGCADRKNTRPAMPCWAQVSLPKVTKQEPRLAHDRS